MTVPVIPRGVLMTSINCVKAATVALKFCHNLLIDRKVVYLEAKRCQVLISRQEGNFLCLYCNNMRGRKRLNVIKLGITRLAALLTLPEALRLPGISLS